MVSLQTNHNRICYLNRHELILFIYLICQKKRNHPCIRGNLRQIPPPLAGLHEIFIKFVADKNDIPMSLLNNSNKKGKKKDQQQRNNPGFPSPKGKANTKAISKNTKLTGGSQRGS